jgi:thiamine kinase-like enzyme
MEKLDNLPDAIKRLLNADEVAISLEALEGGLSNDVFKLVTTSRELVVHMLPEEDATLGVNRENEFAVYNNAKLSDLTAKLVAYFPKEKLFVTEYLPGRHMVEKQFDDMCCLEKVIRALKRLHQSDAAKSVYFPVKHAVHCYGMSHKRHFDIPRGAREALELANNINRSASPLCLVTCHNDLWLPNVLESGDIHFLDFEYAGLNDPMFDLACLANNAKLSPDAMQDMLTLYFMNPLPVLYNDLQASRALVYLRDAMWSTLQAGLKQNDKLYQFAQTSLDHFFGLLEHDIDFEKLA